jgi:dienelactone hydrolase
VEAWAEGEPGARFREEDVPPYTLPPVLTRGTPWEERREELLSLFRDHVYGRPPPDPERLRFEVTSDTVPGGAAVHRRVDVVSEHGPERHRFRLDLLLPAGAAGPVPVFLLLNHRAPRFADPARPAASPFWPARALLERGYGAAVVQTAALAPDDPARYRSGALRLAEGPPSPAAPGALAAWAWGAHRALDYLVTDPAVDPRRLALVGHSRGGKAALWAAAQDDRVALVVSNESGAGGAALSRRAYGETVGRITRAFPHWFAPAFAAYAGRERDLPVDQHQLLALVAPRAVYVASADEDLWADPRGEFASLAAASAAFALYGDPALTPGDMPGVDVPVAWGRRGYHVRSGGHDLTRYDWDRFVDFADDVWDQP